MADGAKMTRAKIDEHLSSQLSASPGDSQIEAVVTLHPDDPAQAAPTPERTEEMARQLVDRVTRSAGVAPKTVNVFKYLGSFSIAADAKFISSLVEQPEVKSAMGNQRQRDAAVA
jgi:hypothetical protein